MLVVDCPPFNFHLCLPECASFSFRYSLLLFLLVAECFSNRSATWTPFSFQDRFPFFHMLGQITYLFVLFNLHVVHLGFPHHTVGIFTVFIWLALLLFFLYLLVLILITCWLACFLTLEMVCSVFSFVKGFFSL